MTEVIVQDAANVTLLANDIDQYNVSLCQLTTEKSIDVQIPSTVNDLPKKT